MEFIYDETKHADQIVTDPGERQVFAVLDTLLDGLLQGARETFVMDGYTVPEVENREEVFSEARGHLAAALGNAHGVYWERLIQDPANVAHAESRREVDKERIEKAQAKLFGSLLDSDELRQALRSLDF